MTKLTHFNKSGEAHMVDIGDKDSTTRRAVVKGRISMKDQTLALINQASTKKATCSASLELPASWRPNAPLI